MSLTVEPMNSAFLAGSRHRRQTGEHRADRPVVLHRGHVVVDLIRDHLAVRVQSDFDVRERSRRLRGPLEILGAASTARAPACQRPSTG